MIQCSCGLTIHAVVKGRFKCVCGKLHVDGKELPNQSGCYGVGSVTSRHIQERLGISSCGLCKDLIDEMNEKGPDWCEENKRDLAAKMVANSKKMREKLAEGDEELELTEDEQGRLKRLKYVPTPIQLFGAVQLIEESIRRFRDKEN